MTDLDVLSDPPPPPPAEPVRLVDVIYEGDVPATYGTTKLEKGAVFQANALDAKALVKNSILFRFSDEHKAVATILQHEAEIDERVLASAKSNASPSEKQPDLAAEANAKEETRARIRKMLEE